MKFDKLLDLHARTIVRRHNLRYISIASVDVRDAHAVGDDLAILQMHRHTAICPMVRRTLHPVGEFHLVAESIGNFMKDEWFCPKLEFTKTK